MSQPSSKPRQGSGFNIRNIGMFNKPQIEIFFEGSDSDGPGSIKTYSTLDPIKGIVKITASKDTRFDDLEIAMLGITKTYVDKMASSSSMSGRQEAIHRFLKLTMPILESEFPEPRVFKAGQTYSFSFTFGVPQHLLPKACTHGCVNEHVRDAHLQVPPSFGEHDIAGYGLHSLDDMAPSMSKIVYSVRAQIIRFRSEEAGNHVVAEQSRKIRVKPAVDEQPPLDLDLYGKNEDYCLRQEKTIRKGVIKGKLGRLVMEASQPKSFKLPAEQVNSSVPSISSMVKVILRFDPAEQHSSPPTLNSLNSKLKVSTFYSSSPRVAFPTRANLAIDMTQGYISEFVGLSSMCVASVDWRKHEAWESPISRRDSTLSMMSTATTATMSSNTASSTIIPDPSSSYKGKNFYTATILVPLSLPTNKYLVPGFHTCLVSRVYGIHVNLSCTSHPITASMTLKIPVQISSEGSVDSVARRRQSEVTEMASWQADEAFSPRNIGPPPNVFLGQSQLGGSIPEEPAAYSPESEQSPSGGPPGYSMDVRHVTGRPMARHVNFMSLVRS